MKLQISFDLLDLEKAISIGQEVAEFADVLEVGTILIYNYGQEAVKTFRQNFPNKTILADAKIADNAKETVTLFANAGADLITVMAGASKNTIFTATSVAHSLGKHIMLDLLDSSSPGQSALEAQSLGVDAILFHKPQDDEEKLLFIESWEMVRGNTKLPLYVSTTINRESINDIISINPYAIVIGKPIVTAQAPKTEADFYSKLIKA